MEKVIIKTCVRCEVCDKYKTEDNELSVGDKVNFATSTNRGQTTRISIKTGKIQTINPNRVGVVYRKKLSVHHPDNLTDPNGASALSVALTGMCTCQN